MPYIYKNITINNQLVEHAAKDEKSPFVLRIPNEDDFSSMASMMSDIFGYHAYQEFYKPQENTFYIIASRGEHIIGALSYDIEEKKDNRELNIAYLGVSEAFKNKQIGSYLMTAALYHGKEIGRTIVNVTAIMNSGPFYEKFGFEGSPSKKKLDLTKPIQSPLRFFTQREAEGDKEKEELKRDINVNKKM